MNMFKKYFLVFIISMIPLIELRGAIPFAKAMDMPIIQSYIVAIIGNMVPVPFIYIFARKILIWGSNKKVLSKPFKFFLQKGENAGNAIIKKAGNKATYFGLFLFVGVPLPGTGAWTGMLAASILELDFKKSVLATLAGVALAGVIMILASLGIFTIIGNFL